MVKVDSYLRIFRWRGLTGQILLNGQPDPHETAVALIQLAALTRLPSSITAALPHPLYRVLTEQVDERGVTSGEMIDPVARGLFLSDLYDFLCLFKRFEGESKHVALSDREQREEGSDEGSKP